MQYYYLSKNSGARCNLYSHNPSTSFSLPSCNSSSVYLKTGKHITKGDQHSRHRFVLYRNRQKAKAVQNYYLQRYESWERKGLKISVKPDSLLLDFRVVLKQAVFCCRLLSVSWCRENGYLAPKMSKWKIMTTKTTTLKIENVIKYLRSTSYSPPLVGKARFRSYP